MRWTVATALLALLLTPTALTAADAPDVGKVYQRYIDKAWKQAADGKSPADACSAIKGKVRGLLEGSHDEDVMAEAQAALDVCNVTLPVHYFDTYLGAIGTDDNTCVNLMIAMKTQLTAMTINLGLRDDTTDPKREIKEALRERIEAICPQVAVVVLR